MKKLFTLLVLMVCAIGTAWADDVIIFSADAISTTDQNFPEGTTEITSSQATISGGKMYAISGQSVEKVLITKNGEFSMTNNNTYFKIELNMALAVGDRIIAKSHGGVKNSDNKGLWISTTDSRPSDAPTCSAAAAEPTNMTAGFLNYSIVDGDEYVGRTTLYVYRAAGATQNFDEFKVTRADSRTPAELAFASTSGNVDMATNSTFTLPSLTKTPSDANVTYSSSKPSVATVDESTGTVTLVATGTTVITASFAGNATYSAATAEFTLTVTNSNIKVVGYTESINGNKLDDRVLSGIGHVSISGPIFGSNISGQGSKDVYIDNVLYTNNKSWRKSQNGTYDGQNVGYTLTVEKGYKMNISHVSARIAVADDTYSWYVEILNGAGTQVWRSGEKTTTKASSGVVDANVTDKKDIQGLTGNVTVNLWVKQGGSTKYFSINYLQLEVDTEVDDRPTYTMSVSQNIEEGCSVTPENEATVTQGESVAFTATPATEYKFVKWVIDEVNQNTNPYIIENVTSNHTAVAHFAKRYKVSYDLGGYNGTITGKVLCNVNRSNEYDEVYSDDDDYYTIPAYADKYLYNKGYVFDKWQDGDGNTYSSGEKIAMTKDITLTPTWKAATESLYSSSSETTVTWSFAKADILFCDWQSSDKFGYYTQTAIVNDQSIAVPMQITKGKVGNWSRTDAIAQTNKETTFTIPAVDGMTIEIADANVAFSTTTIAGSTDYTKSNDDKTISYKYNGTDATIDIVVGEDKQYLKTIVVKYPAATKIGITTTKEYTTYVAEANLDFSEVSGLEAYVVTTVSSTAATLEKVETVAKGTPLILKGIVTNAVVSIAASASEPTQNLLMAGPAMLTGDGTEYILVDGKFYESTAGDLSAGKAYLKTNGNVSARLDIYFGNEATGISNVNNAQPDEAVYNLSGVRVKTAQKGIYIQNGKKIAR